jgi:hypothetical protein
LQVITTFTAPAPDWPSTSSCASSCLGLLHVGLHLLGLLHQSGYATFHHFLVLLELNGFYRRLVDAGVEQVHHVAHEGILFDRGDRLLLALALAILAARRGRLARPVRPR